MKMFEPQRTHPFGIINAFIKNLRLILNALLPTIIILISNSTGRRFILPAVGLILIVYIGYNLAVWYRFVYYIADEELRIEYGLIARKKRYVPLERIQSIQIRVSLIQRWLGLVSLQVETAGGGPQAEVLLSSIRREHAEKLRQILEPGHSTTSDTMADRQENPAFSQYRLSGTELLITALTSSSIGFIFAGMFALLSQVSQFLPEAIDPYLLTEQYLDLLLHMGWLIALCIILMILLLAWLIAIVLEVMRWSNFLLVVEEDQLRISHGLLTRHQISIPRHRIQALQITESLLRQPFGLLSLKVISASGTAGKSDSSVIMPILHRSKLSQFLYNAVPELALDQLEPMPLPTRAAPRYFIVLFLPLALLSVLCWILLPYGYLALLLLPLGIWWSWQQYRDAGYHLEYERLLMRRRRLARISIIVSRRRIQSLDFSQSVFQRRRRLIGIHTAIAYGNGGLYPLVIGVDEDKIPQLVYWYAKK